MRGIAMSSIRRLLTMCLLGSACAALAGCVMDETHAAEPQRSINVPAATAAGPTGSRNSIQNVEYAILGSRTLVRVRFRNDVQERPPVVVGYHPVAYIALDFIDTASEIAKENIEAGERELRSLQLVSGGNRVRLVLRLARPAPYEVAIEGRELLLTLHRPVTAG